MYVCMYVCMTKTLQLLSTNMAAVTSATNQQYGQKIIRFQTETAWYMRVNKKNDFRKIPQNSENKPLQI